MIAITVLLPANVLAQEPDGGAPPEEDDVREAAASEESRLAEKCHLAYALSALNVDERMLLEDICRGHPRMDPRQLQKGEKQIAHFTAFIHALERMSVRLTARGDWQLGAFYQLLPEPVADSLGKTEEMKLKDISQGSSEADPLEIIEDLFEHWGEGSAWQSTCPAMRSELAEMVRAWRTAANPHLGLWSDDQDTGVAKKGKGLARGSSHKISPGKDRCAVMLDGRLIDAMQKYVFLLVLAPDGSDGAGAFVVRSGVPLRRMPIFVTDIVSGVNKLHIAVVERGMPYMMSVSNPAFKIPVVVRKFARDEDIVELEAASPTPACLDLNVRVDNSSVVLVDGVPVRSNGAIMIPRQDVTLTVLRKGDGAGAVQHEETITKEDLGQNNKCTYIKRDLGSSNIITLTPFGEEASCAEAGVSIGTLWGEAAKYLDGRAGAVGLEFRDMRTVAGVVGFLVELRESLTFSNVDPIGAPRKSADSEYLAKTAAEELWRQGVTRVITVDLQCEKPDAAGNTRLSILARDVDIGSIFDEVKDPVKGVALKNFVTMQTEAVSRSNQLEPALRRVITRLLDLPYLRLSSPRDSFRYTEAINLYMEYVAGGHGATPETPNVAVYRFSQDQDRKTCDQLERSGQLAGREPPEISLGPQESIARVTPLQGVSGGKATVAGYEVELLPKSEGRYLVRAAFAEGGDSRDGAVYKCIDIQPATSSVWGVFGVGLRGVRSEYQIGGDADESVQTPYSSVQTNVALGFGFYSAQRYGNWLFGGYLGTTKINYSVRGPLSWDYFVHAESDDAGTHEFGEDGELHLEWQRNSIDLGVSIDFIGSVGKTALNRWEFFRRRITRKIVWVAGAQMGLSLGIVHVGEEVRNLVFYEEDHISEWLFDTDFGVNVKLGLGINVTPRARIDALFEGRFQAFDDWLESRIGELDGDVEHMVTYDAAFVPAIVVRVGYDLR